MASPNNPDASPATNPTLNSTNRKHLYSFRNLLLALLLLLVLVGVYLWQHSKVNNLNSQVKNLNTQVSSLKGQLAQEKANSADVKKVGWSALPSDLQKTISATWLKEVKTCLDQNKGPQTDSAKSYYLADGQFASAPVGCTNPTTHFFVKSNGSWQDINLTQLGLPCSQVQNNPLIKGLFDSLGMKCT